VEQRLLVGWGIEHWDLRFRCRLGRAGNLPSVIADGAWLVYATLLFHPLHRLGSHRKPRKYLRSPSCRRRRGIELETQQIEMKNPGCRLRMWSKNRGLSLPPRQ
jgi:hypothetical protein